VKFWDATVSVKLCLMIAKKVLRLKTLSYETVNSFASTVAGAVAAIAVLKHLILYRNIPELTVGISDMSNNYYFCIVLKNKNYKNIFEIS
jgi:hypothetical protein